MTDKNTEQEAAAEQSQTETTAQAKKADTEQAKKGEKKPVGLPDPEEKVSYTAPLDPKGEAMDVFVCVNGESIRIQRGVPVTIKRKFVEVLDNAAAQAVAARQVQREAMKRAETATAAM